MNELDKSTILALEHRLKNAMLNSEISELDAMLADELIFTNHLGHLMTKQEDLRAHKMGHLKIDIIEFRDVKIIPFNGMALVNVEVRLVGSFNGEATAATLRFSRVWRRGPNDSWQVIMAHSTQVV